MSKGYYGFAGINTEQRKQVFWATHNGAGQRLPLMHRSFISFSFGGKYIEDFNLIATITDNNINRNGYAAFEDKISTYEVLDGQQYWGTHYQNNTIDFTLATDGIDQRCLDDFLYWFSAGCTRELILAEHPNRGILARVNTVPELNLLPFEQAINIMIANQSCQTSTTLYKGIIRLSLVMDEPHWYAIRNILGKLVDYDGNQKRYIDKWTDANGNEVDIFASQDALKILYEDGIPLGSMISDNMLLGNGAYANIEGDNDKQIWTPPQTGIPEGAIVPSGEDYFGNDIYKAWLIGEGSYGARIYGTINGNENPSSQYIVGDYHGYIAGAIVDGSGNGINNFSINQTAYFYYAGTAPSPIKISFRLQLKMSNDNKHYIITPYNQITPVYSNRTETYCTITIGSETEQKLCFSIPNLLIGYNKVIEIFDQQTEYNKARVLIRDNVRHPAVRAWANKVLDYGEDKEKNINELFDFMSYFLRDENGLPYYFNFEFNSKTGEAFGELQYREVDLSTLEVDSDWIKYGTVISKIEDVGDMLITNHLIIRDRNYPNSNGRIVRWNDLEDKGRGYSHYIKHNLDQPLDNFMLIYKNMYL